MREAGGSSVGLAGQLFKFLLAVATPCTEVVNYIAPEIGASASVTDCLDAALVWEVGQGEK